MANNLFFVKLLECRPIRPLSLFHYITETLVTSALVVEDVRAE